MNTALDNTYLNYFANSLLDTFKHWTNIKPEIGVPYIQDNTTDLGMEYMGIIGVSGAKGGYICFTANKDFAQGFTQKVMGGGDIEDEAIVDTICEIANTIAGNAQEHFGADFMISVPMLVAKSKVNTIKISSPIYIVPIIWDGIKSNLVIAIEG